MADGVGLPPYTVRYSARARHVRLAVSAREGLVVTLPLGVAGEAAEQAVRSREAWAWRHLARTAELRAALSAPPEALLPSVIDLAAFMERWPVEYRESERARVSARATGAAVVLSGPVDDAAACLEALRRWRDRTARERLPGMLAGLSSATGIPYTRASVRAQRTRWGSCSSSGTISLNRNLVFLPEHLVHYVLAHELTHVRVPNHSARFWALLESMAPGADGHRVAMRSAAERIPAWAHE